MTAIHFPCRLLALCMEIERDITGWCGAKFFTVTGRDRHETQGLVILHLAFIDDAQTMQISSGLTHCLKPVALHLGFCSQGILFIWTILRLPAWARALAMLFLIQIQVPDSASIASESPRRIFRERVTVPP